MVQNALLVRVVLVYQCDMCVCIYKKSTCLFFTVLHVNARCDQTVSMELREEKDVSRVTVHKTFHYKDKCTFEKTISTSLQSCGKKKSGQMSHASPCSWRVNECVCGLHWESVPEWSQWGAPLALINRGGIFLMGFGFALIIFILIGVDSSSMIAISGHGMGFLVT